MLGMICNGVFGNSQDRLADLAHLTVPALSRHRGHGKAANENDKCAAAVRTRRGGTSGDGPGSYYQVVISRSSRGLKEVLLITAWQLILR
jgi:hypothetical protein